MLFLDGFQTNKFILFNFTTRHRLLCCVPLLWGLPLERIPKPPQSTRRRNPTLPGNHERKYMHFASTIPHWPSTNQPTLLPRTTRTLLCIVVSRRNRLKYWALRCAKSVAFACSARCTLQHAFAFGLVFRK